MSIFITKIKLYNFRRFREFVIEPNTKNNILIGDNESGKSTILEAIDLVSGGNNRRVEAIGLDNLLNIEAVTEFINSDRCYADLPKLRVELYLSGASDPSVNGENNSDKIECDGIKLVCEPNEDYKTEITSAMDAQSDYFPYEYYSIRFSTFADQVYTGYKRKLRCAMVNSDNMDSEYATNDFIKRTYYHRLTRANTPDSVSFRRFLSFSSWRASASLQRNVARQHRREYADSARLHLKSQKSLENTSLAGT